MAIVANYRCTVLGAIFLCALGCDPDLPGKPNPKDRPVPVENVLAFDELFNRNCAGCHGPDGKQGAAPPLNDALFRAAVPASELEKVLTHGRPGTSMPPFLRASGGPLSAAQVQVLVQQIKGVPYRIVETGTGKQARAEIVPDAKGVPPVWGVPPTLPASTPPYLLPDASGNADQGAKLFGRACAGCHGENGLGVVRDDQRRNKINDRTFLALISDQALRRIMITGRPDFHMPTYAEKTARPDDFRPLTSQDIADIGALLAVWRQGKAGQ